MGIVKENDVKRLMGDAEFMSEIAGALAQDPQTMDDLADEIAGKIQDELEDNEEWRSTLVSAAMSSPEFKKKVVSKLAEELG